MLTIMGNISTALDHISQGKKKISLFFAKTINGGLILMRYNNNKRKTGKMGKGRPEKYNRISCQLKFMLRRLIIKEKLSVKQVKLHLILGCSKSKH